MPSYQSVTHTIVHSPLQQSLFKPRMRNSNFLQPLMVDILTKLTLAPFDGWFSHYSLGSEVGEALHAYVFYLGYVVSVTFKISVLNALFVGGFTH